LRRHKCQAKEVTTQLECFCLVDREPTSIVFARDS
jgi:hypothetical protein